MALLEGLEFGCDLGVTLEISFSVLPVIVLGVLVCMQVLLLSEKLEALCFEMLRADKAGYINDQTLFVYFATCCVFPAITVVLYFFLICLPL